MATNILPKAALVACILTVTLAAAQRPQSSYDPAPKHPAKQHDSLIDFVLKHINPTDKDYGEWLEQVRKSAIDAGLDSLPRLLSGALLICSFVVIVHQNKERKHREIIAARFLAWYHNELVHARETAREAITRNQRLKKIIDEQAEAERPLETAQPVSNSGPSVAGNGATRTASAAPKTTPVNDYDLLTEINKLREKVAVLEDTEKTLKRQISQLHVRLQEEKQKNHALKGE
jgi:hypothetical protein